MSSPDDASRSAPDTEAATPAPPEPLDLSEVQALTHTELLNRARDLGLRAKQEVSRHAVTFDIARAHLALGGELRSSGIFEQNGSHGILRFPRFNFLPTACDIVVPQATTNAHDLRSGLMVSGILRGPKDRERHLVLDRIDVIEGVPASEWQPLPDFDKLTPMFPNERLLLESPDGQDISARAVDLIAPLGKGQRGLLVAPPRVGKTMLLQSIARAILKNDPSVTLILLLVDERPEEVTDMRRELDCEIYSSTFDESPSRHIQVAERVADRAKRLVEMKKNVVVLLDSITRLSRGYNNMTGGKGRTMSGGVDAKALTKPKKFFGAARNVEEGGSLTILATALIETQSRMDDLIFEEYKGTGNMEVHLDRGIAENRIFPAIHITQSGTRKEELLYHPDELDRVIALRKQLMELPAIEAMEVLSENLRATRTNAELLLSGLLTLR